jgi:uncharacterized Zn-finger protein
VNHIKLVAVFGEFTMSDTQASNSKNEKIANAQQRYEITKDDLPLHCPMEGMSLWNSHPRVYIPMNDGRGKCPYCGAEYVLHD